MKQRPKPIAPRILRWSRVSSLKKITENLIIWNFDDQIFENRSQHWTISNF